MISQSGLGIFLAPDEKYFVFNCFGGCWKRHVLQHVAGVGHMQNLYLTILTLCFFLIPKGPFWRVYRAIIRSTFIFRPTFYFTHQPREFRAYFYFMCSFQDGIRHIRLLKCPHIFKDFHLFIDTVLFSLKLWRSSAFLPLLSWLHFLPAAKRQGQAKLWVEKKERDLWILGHWNFWL